MLQDLDAVMAKHRLDAMIVYGSSTYGNPELRYVVGANLARGGIFLKQRMRDPILVVSNIDHGQASKGIVNNVVTYSKYGYEKLLAKHGRDLAAPLLMDRILRRHKVKGNIGLHGRNDASDLLNLTKSLRGFGHKITGEKHPTTLESIMETKSLSEIHRIMEVGGRTEKVVGKTIDFLERCHQDGGRLTFEGQKLTVGMIKAVTRRHLAEENLIAPEDFIIAAGLRSADPHYPGEDSDPVVVGQPIVFDIFPQDAGGYCYDMTRTFVFGEPSTEIRRMHESVLKAQQIAFDLVHEGCRVEKLMNSVCDHFSRDGFKTIRDLNKGDREAEKTGFVHSLGHGVGLTIGEKPYLSLHSDDILKVGHVFTIEPGLYDARVGGVRVEDVIALTESGPLNLTSFGKTLQI
jgi:Xaa-Pro aminopeptidase